jgi:hypothetical protein
LKLKSHVASSLGRGEHRLFDRWRPTGYWLEQGLHGQDVKAARISEVLAGYRVRDAAAGGEIPEYYKGSPGDHLFESAFPLARVDEVLECIRAR